MSTEYVWNRKSTLLLIRIYKEYKSLWDPTHPNHKNKLMRVNAIREIGNLLGIDKNEIARKIKNLMSHFVREIKKEKACTGDGLVPAYKSKWFAYKAMAFLKKRPGHKAIDVNEMLVIAKDEASQESVESGQSKDSSKIIVSDCRTSCIEDPLLDINDAKSECSSNLKDESASFGEYIANKVRLMDKRTRAIVEYEINSTIFKAEMGYYNDKKIDLDNNLQY